MSLLVINSANRVAQGIIKSLHHSSKFERILCADIYPSYSVNQKWFTFLEDLNASSKTKIADMKIDDRSDLVRALGQSSHVVFVTHDYYELVFSKLSMVVNAAKLAKEAKVKKFVSVSPVEHYHYGEQAPFEAQTKAEEEARKANDKVVTIQSDLVVGPYADAVRGIMTRIASGKTLHFAPSQQKVSPIHSDNLAELVDAVLAGDFAGQSLVAKGNETLDWNEVLSVLEKSLGGKATTSRGSPLCNPLSNNLLSETCFKPCYRNLVQFVNKYQSPEGKLDSAKFKLTLKSFKESYPEGGFRKEDFAPKCSYSECTLKWLFG